VPFFFVAEVQPSPFDNWLRDGSIATPRSVHIRSRMHEPNRHRRLAALRTLKIVKVASRSLVQQTQLQ
jgi:hypothetical protein